MNKLVYVITVTLLLSIMPSHATDISGVTGNNGVYNITPEKMNGSVGFRQYENFNLSKGDVANLIFTEGRDPNNYWGGNVHKTFVNLVNNKVNIDGILNTTFSNGNYYNGNAVFITPGGFTVGASGVLNVGSLSVATPTTTTYNKLLNQYASGDLANISSEVSSLSRNLKGNAGAADIKIQGKVLARKGVEMTGKNVDVSGTIINGVTTENLLYGGDYDVAINSNKQAEQLFRSLVNTDGMMPQWQGDSEEYGNKFENNGSQVYIKSTKGMNVSGSVNNGGGNLYLTNQGSKGLTVTGTVDADKEANLFNTSGDLKIDGNAIIQGRKSSNITNSGRNLTLGKDTIVNSYNNIEILNKGSGKLTSSGRLISGANENAYGNSNITITNKGSGMVIDGAIYNANTVSKQGNINITNHKGDLVLNNKIINFNGDTNINNYGKNIVIKPNADIKNYEGKLIIKNYPNNDAVATTSMKDYRKLETRDSMTNLIRNDNIKVINKNILSKSNSSKNNLLYVTRR